MMPSSTTEARETAVGLKEAAKPNNLMKFLPFDRIKVTWKATCDGDYQSDAP